MCATLPAVLFHLTRRECAPPCRLSCFTQYKIVWERSWISTETLCECETVEFRHPVLRHANSDVTTAEHFVFCEIQSVVWFSTLIGGHHRWSSPWVSPLCTVTCWLSSFCFWNTIVKYSFSLDIFLSVNYHVSKNALLRSGVRAS